MPLFFFLRVETKNNILKKSEKKKGEWKSMLIAEYRNRQNDSVEIYKRSGSVKKINRSTGKEVLYSGYYGKEIYDLVNEIITSDAPVRHLVYHNSYPFHYVPGEKMCYHGYETVPEYDSDSGVWIGKATDDEGNAVWFACRSLEDFWDEFRSVADAREKEKK